ncbi:EpsG family protein [Halalkalibaculum sp. DA3122]|uniref:EpsG family protein n=1 Tax=unclassified Halalkalibaculum TaxID=2964617 RepID=UPI003754C693
MNNSEGKTGFYSAILFLVWPLLALVSAFRNYRSSWGKNILWAFVAFYGLCFAIGTESQGSDIVRYVEEVQILHERSLSLSGALDYYLESGELDIFRTLIALVVSRVSGSQVVLTLVFGTIFGFFYSRNIWYVLEQLQGKIRMITYLLLICFALIVPVWYMNGFRMWTATHIFLYGLLPYLFEEKRSGLAVASLSILMHFSFIVPVGLLYGYIFLGNRVTLYFLFFISTFFISEINLTVINNFMQTYAPEILYERTDSYLVESEGQGGEGGGGPVWYARFYTVALKWSVMGFLVVLYLKGKNFFLKNRRWMNMFSFILLFYGTANILSLIPSGSRYVTIANLCAMALITLYVQNRKDEVVMKRFIALATPALLLFVVVAFRIGLYSMSATAILGNPVIALFLTGDHISLNDALKTLIL